MKGSDNPFPSILVAEQGSAPDTPASGYGRIYCKSDGLYFIDDDGVETGPLGGGGGGTDVAARYSSNAGQSIVTGAAAAIIDFEDESFDTHDAVTTGASWKFTCPAGQGGYYQVNVGISLASSSAWGYGERGLLQLFKEGNAYSNLSRKDNFESTLQMQLGGCDIVNLAEGEYIDIRIAQNSGSNIALVNSNTDVWVSIAKIKG